MAHAAWVERAFLDRALRPRRECLPDEVVDTAALARAAGLARAGTHEPDLESLAREPRACPCTPPTMRWATR